MHRMPFIDDDHWQMPDLRVRAEATHSISHIAAKLDVQSITAMMNKYQE
jgi:hypothetical protein